MWVDRENHKSPGVFLSGEVWACRGEQHEIKIEKDKEREREKNRSEHWTITKYTELSGQQLLENNSLKQKVLHSSANVTTIC